MSDKLCVQILKQTVAHLWKQLVESQAREAQLREAVEFMSLYAPIGSLTHRAQQVLLLPYDNTALKARIVAERERIAEYVDRNLMSAREYAEAIRNLGDE